jgi:hypothetical protein
LVKLFSPAHFLALNLLFINAEKPAAAWIEAVGFLDCPFCGGTGNPRF